MEKSLQRAIRLVGGKYKLADSLGISRPAVTQWQICPVRRVLDVEKLTNNQVTRYQLRPDIYRND